MGRRTSTALLAAMVLMATVLALAGCTAGADTVAGPGAAGEQLQPPPPSGDPTADTQPSDAAPQERVTSEKPVLRGLVQDQDGRPAGGVIVTAFLLDDGAEGSGTSTAEFTDASGRFALDLPVTAEVVRAGVANGGVINLSVAGGRGQGPDARSIGNTLSADVVTVRAGCPSAKTSIEGADDPCYTRVETQPSPGTRLALALPKELRLTLMSRPG